MHLYGEKLTLYPCGRRVGVVETAHGKDVLSQKGESEIVSLKVTILKRRLQVCRKGYASFCTV